jgi:hypothetical protein
MKSPDTYAPWQVGNLPHILTALVIRTTR